MNQTVTSHSTVQKKNRPSRAHGEENLRDVKGEERYATDE